MFDINALKKSCLYSSRFYSTDSKTGGSSELLFNFKSCDCDSVSMNKENTSSVTANKKTTYSTSQSTIANVLKNMRTKISTILSNKTTTTQTKEIETEEDIEAKIDEIKDKTTPKTQQTEVQTEEKKEIASLGINGEIEGVIKQGATGDCWILSSLLAVNSTEKGKELIKNSIKVNSDDTVTVNFNGINKSYTISKNEISKYDTDNDLCDSMSNGDNDVLAFELAVAKLRQDLANGKVKTDKSFANYNNGKVSDLSTAIEGGYDVAMLYYLTGKTPTAIKLNSDATTTCTALNYILNNVDTKNSAIVVDLKEGSSSATCVDGTKYDLIIDGIHSVAVKNLTKSTITILDSWDTSKEYTMTWEEFAKLNLSQIAYTNLN